MNYIKTGKKEMVTSKWMKPDKVESFSEHLIRLKKIVSDEPKKNIIIFDFDLTLIPIHTRGQPDMERFRKEKEPQLIGVNAKEYHEFVPKDELLRIGKYLRELLTCHRNLRNS